MAAILCAVNDSPGANAALGVARQLSETLQLRLIVAHVAPGYAVDGGSESVTTAQGRRGGIRLLERLVTENDVGLAEQRVEIGEPAAELARIAREEAATVIILGSRKRGWPRAALQTAIAGELAETAPCPVLVVPPGSRR
jgi:nucleotide-binding universal stress UspA family protein